jgi:hypothetical protein
MAMPKINQSPSNSGDPISPDNTSERMDTRTSAKMLNEAGTGSRPVKSAYPIKTSAPMDNYTLGRAPQGYLKQTGGKGEG